MDILLINPPREKLLELESPLDLEQQKGQYPPLGLLYLASYIEMLTPFKTDVLDCWALKLTHTELAQLIKEKQPQVVGLSATTLNLLDALTVADMVKNIDSTIHVVMGGPHPSVYPLETLAFSSIDTVVIGEGEMTFVDLLNHLQSKEDLGSVAGLGYKQNGRSYVNKKRELISDLDTIPFPDRTKIPYQNYYSLASRGNPRFTTMMSSRGCPFQCVFCCLLDKQYRVRTLPNVVAEISECLNLEIEDIFFFDDTFNISRERVLQFCDLIKQKELSFTFSFRGRVTPIDEKMLTVLKSVGCNRIQFGVESGNNTILERMKKGTTVSDIRNAFSLCHKVGIETVAYFILGAPGETQKEIKETISLSTTLNPSFALFTIMMPYPNTELYATALKKNLFDTDIWLEYARNPSLEMKPPFWNENLSYNELVEFHRYAYKRFYFRLSYIVKQFKSIRSLKELWRKIVAAINVLCLR